MIANAVLVGWLAFDGHAEETDTTGSARRQACLESEACSKTVFIDRVFGHRLDPTIDPPNEAVHRLEKPIRFHYHGEKHINGEPLTNFDRTLMHTLLSVHDVAHAVGIDLADDNAALEDVATVTVISEPAAAKAGAADPDTRDRLRQAGVFDALRVLEEVDTNPAADTDSMFYACQPSLIYDNTTKVIHHAGLVVRTDVDPPWASSCVGRRLS